MLLVGYSSASSFPQCFIMKENEKVEAKQRVIQQYLSQAESYVNLLEPRFYMPFAGRYILAGKKSILNTQRSVTELEDAYEYFINSSKINQKEHQCIILNSKSSFDINVGQKSIRYIPINPNEKQFQPKKIESEYTRVGWLGGSSHLSDLNILSGLAGKLNSSHKDKVGKGGIGTAES